MLKVGDKVVCEGCRYKNEITKDWCLGCGTSGPYIGTTGAERKPVLLDYGNIQDFEQILYNLTETE